MANERKSPLALIRAAEQDLSQLRSTNRDLQIELAELKQKLEHKEKLLMQLGDLSSDILSRICDLMSLANRGIQPGFDQVDFDGPAR